MTPVRSQGFFDQYWEHKPLQLNRGDVKCRSRQHHLVRETIEEIGGYCVDEDDRPTAVFAALCADFPGEYSGYNCFR
jgi:hypothetical protein